MSKSGLLLAGGYVLLALFFIAKDGITGESFIALILGMPWTFVPAYFEFWGQTGSAVTRILVGCIAINAFILYLLGKRIFSNRR